MSIVVTVDSKLLRDVLDRLYAVTDDLSPVMKKIGGEMEARIRDRFSARSDPLGLAWEPWRASTVNAYPKDGHRRMLDRFGDMFDSINYEFDDHSVTIGFGQP